MHTPTLLRHVLRTYIYGVISAVMDDDLKSERRSSEVTVFDAPALEDSRPQWKVIGAELIDQTYIATLMTLVTIWALFGDDIRLCATNQNADGGFLVMTYICLVLFFIELTVSSVCKEHYFLGFYFFLDFVATFSLLFDIPQVMEALFGGGGGQGGAADSTTLARAGRTSRVGTRAGRVVRLVRLVRILKLYKQYLLRKQGKVQEMNLTTEEEELAESRVGQKLSDLTTRRVIVGVLLMLFILPLFQMEMGYYGERTTVELSGLKILHNSYPDDYGLVFNQYTTDFYLGILTYVHSLNNPRFGNVRCLILQGQLVYPTGQTVCNSSDLREYPAGDELMTFSTEDEGPFAPSPSKLYMNMTQSVRLEAGLNMARTVFICIILGLGAMMFSRDANKLVLNPIERMVQRVREISENPLQKMVVSKGDKEEEQFETKILENSIAKICSLLSVGFGEAGAEIIGENMKKGGDLDPMIPGKKMVAIFGFCDIRQFTDTTEVLEEEIMEFVNSIAQIVHMEVSLHKGSANKNIGDAFLVVWKFGDADVSIDDFANFEDLPQEKKKKVQDIADGALASFLAIEAHLVKSARLKSYCVRDDLNAQMPGYSVRMGYGLHAGWAIEGAIGSNYKVDASYLSPNVNMAARLEAATKQFGTPILLSSDFVNIMSSKAKKRTRQIDRVTVKGSSKPIGLYTYDCDKSALPDVLNKDISITAEQDSYSHKKFRNEFTEHPDIVKMSTASSDFLNKFDAGYRSYEDGDWPRAVEVLTECLTMNKDSNGNTVKDGPTATLLRVMAENGNVAPKAWPGYRELTEK